MTSEIRPTAGMRCGLYLRCSTDDQSVEAQRQDLEAVAANNGWTIAAEYADEGVSGSKGRAGRPGFDALCTAVTRREVDVVMAWSVCRLGRSLTHLVTFLNLLKAKGVNLYLHQQGVDTTTDMGEAMFGILGVFAAFERAMIRERTRAGLARARAKGTRLGRPPSISPAKAALIRADRRAGESLRKVAARYGTTDTAIIRLERKARDAAQA